MLALASWQVHAVVDIAGIKIGVALSPQKQAIVKINAAYQPTDIKLTTWVSMPLPKKWPDSGSICCNPE